MSLFLIFMIAISTYCLSPPFQSTLRGVQFTPSRPVVFQVQRLDDRYTSLARYWDPTLEGRQSYFNSYNHYQDSIARYPSFTERFGPSRHTAGILKLYLFQRTADGRSNNQKNINFGASQTFLKRSAPPLYTDGVQRPIDSTYNPRQISNQIGSQTYPIKLNKNNVTMAFTIWGQFLDHDISLTEVQKQQQMVISIPKCDIFMDAECEGNKFIPFMRSHHVIEDVFREQVTSVTGWIDGSMVYGSTEEVSKRLRTFKNGKLKVKNGKFLPDLVGNAHNLPDAGDVRAAENLLLLSYHTIFLREHNRLCDIIIQKGQGMTDQQIYQSAKNYVIGLIQKITYEDFLPILLGKKNYDKYIGSYKGYDDSIDPTILSEFSTVAFRFGHSLLVSKFPMMTEDSQIQKQITLNDIFFRPDLMNEQTIEKLLRGLTYTLVKQRDGTLIDQVRNLLVTAPQNRNIHLDLFALNIQRARDHGLQRYNYLRKTFGLEPLKNFNELTDDPQRAKKLSKLYQGNINAMDSFVGILNERNVEGGIVGELGSIIIGHTFRNLREGDRYWYESMLSSSVQAEIKGTFLSQILIRNTNIGQLQEDVFHYLTNYRTIKSN